MIINLLRNYFESIVNIEVRKGRVSVLEENAGVLERQLRTTDINIPEQSFETNWEALGGSGGGNEGYSDRAIDRIIGNIIREQDKILALINELEDEIDFYSQVIENLDKLDDIIFELSREEWNILYFKYGKNLTDLQASLECNIATGSFSKIKLDLINRIHVRYNS